MSEQEGVIQFNLSHKDTGALQHTQLTSLILCHQHMHRLGLIGQHPARYDGYAYGNISHRLTANEFLVSGTQTGGIDTLTNRHYAHVLHCDISNNTVKSCGPVQPSSECMSHAAIYATDPKIMAIIHIHNPDIWQQHKALQLATTSNDINYGTPEMAIAIQNCVQQYPQGIAMLGHLDGIICYGNTLEAVDQHLCHLHQHALSLI
jgi:hypothetical protein